MLAAFLAFTAPPAAATEQPPPPARNLAKTRPGSVLKGDKPLPPAADLRSEAERHRDAELVLHFSRMAELDVLAALAAETRDLALQEQVEHVRRKEVQRHQKFMILLRRGVAPASVAAGER